jgi:hypothetical protein
MPYGGDPAASFADAVRFEIGDTDPANELVTDAEIAYLRSTYGDDVLTVAAEAALRLANNYASLIDQKVGKVQVWYSQRAAQFRKVYDDLRRRMALDATPYAGGISKTTIEQEEEDEDRPEPFFSTEMLDG